MLCSIVFLLNFVLKSYINKVIFFSFLFKVSLSELVQYETNSSIETNLIYLIYCFPGLIQFILIIVHNSRFIICIKNVNVLILTRLFDY